MAPEDRPFKVHEIDSPPAVLKLANWLRLLGNDDSDPAGVAVRQRGPVRLALASDQDVVLVDKDETGLARSAIVSAVMGGTPPRFVTRDLADTLVALYRWLRPDSEDFFERLGRAFVGDLEGIQHTCGQPVPPRSKFKTLADDAFDARLTEPQLQFDAPRYYFAISLPWARLRAEHTLFGKKEPVTWWISYENLWLRVLASYTGDPTLRWALTEGQDPIEAAGKLVGAKSHEEAEALLVWQALGGSVTVMAQTFPQLYDQLPENLPHYLGQFERHMPGLVLGVSSMMRAYLEKRVARTRYERRLGRNYPPAASCLHTIFGTVMDILQVAAVSFWNLRPNRGMMITVPTCDLRWMINSPLRVCGTGEPENFKTWLDQVAAIAPLGNPLWDLPLAPSVIKAPLGA